jgi:putative tryptophan/tyrosine transport system substrate-binding protein
MAIHIRRREFIATLGGAALWPITVRAQQSAMPVIGFLNTGSSGEILHLFAAFRQGLREVGYIEGQNVLVEYRWADNQFDRLPALATDLVHHQVQVIVATPVASWRAAKAATASIPIVFQGGGDPVGLGLVASLNRPGGNATGVINISSELTAKRLDVLHELVPTASRIAALTNPNSPIAQHQLQDVVVAARTTGQEVYVVNASSEHEIEEAFASALQQHADALLVITDSVFTNRREQIVTLAARYTIPAIYPFRDFADAGGLISYGSNLADDWRKTGIYTGRILKGEKPADLPVLLPTKFELVINRKTAKALGLAIPDKLLALADEVFE